jgi:hypothetical protein
VDSIRQLAEKKAKLEEELAAVRAEIAARAGEVDPDPEEKPAAKTTAAKKA